MVFISWYFANFVVMEHFYIIILYIIGLVILSAFFSGSEIAFLASDKLRIELKRNQGGIAGRMLELLFSRPDRYVTTLLVGNNVVLVVYGLLMGKLLHPLLEQWHLNEWFIVFINSIISTFLIVIFGEYLPKVSSRRHANRWLYRLLLPLSFFYIVFFPFALLCTGLSRIAIWILSPKQPYKVPAPQLTTIDLDNYLLSSSDANAQQDEDSLKTEVKIIRNALDFSKIQARDCMIPRNEIVAVELDTDLETLKNSFIESGLTKIVVYREGIDDVVGYIHSAEVFRGEDWQTRLKTALFVPESMYGSILMQHLMQSKTSIAIVVDELGGTAGMVTLEDLVEEIFGDIKDEHDTNHIVVKKQDDHNFILSGRLEIDDANEQLGLDLPESDEYITIAGLILDAHPHLPNPGEEVEIGPFTFKILRASETKIELVKLTVAPD